MTSPNPSGKLCPNHALRRGISLGLLPILAAIVGASCAEAPECECDAAITKLVFQNPVAGGTALFGLFVNYSGHPLCQNGTLCVDDNLPTGLSCDPSDPAYTPSSGVNSDWTCSCTGGSAVHCCLNGALPTSSTNLQMITVPVLVAANAPASVKNCASLAQGFPGSFIDNTSTNNTSCLETKVTAPKIDLGITKSHDIPLNYNGLSVFHLAVSNEGNAVATGFSVTDVLPLGFTFTGTSSTGWTCTAVPAMPMLGQHQTVTCTFSGMLSPMTSTLLDLNVALGDPKAFVGGKPVNCATVAMNGDVNANNDNSCDPFCIDYTTHFASGVDDAFSTANGQESPSPSPDFLSWINDNYAIMGVRDYDDQTPNRWFGHTFTNLEAPPGYAICGGQLNLRVRCNDINDNVLLRFTGPSGPDPSENWGHYFNTPPFNSPCDGVATTLITLDLANLPPNASMPTNLLPFLTVHGFLDVGVQDDSGVDYLSLDLTYCCL